MKQISFLLLATLFLASCQPKPVIVHLIPNRYSGFIHLLSDSVKNSVHKHKDTFFIAYNKQGIAYLKEGVNKNWGVYHEWNTVYVFADKNGKILQKAYTEHIKDTHSGPCDNYLHYLSNMVHEKWADTTVFRHQMPNFDSICLDIEQKTR